MANKKNNVKKAIKKSKLNRNSVSIEQKKIEIENNKKKVKLVQEKDYIRNLFNGRYYLARMNMMADQINDGKIIETIDGCTKSGDLMKAEYALMRMQAIEGFRNSNMAKKNLLDSGFTEEEIKSMEMAWYTQKIVEFKLEDEKKSKAEFMDE